MHNHTSSTLSYRDDRSRIATAAGIARPDGRQQTAVSHIWNCWCASLLVDIICIMRANNSERTTWWERSLHTRGHSLGDEHFDRLSAGSSGNSSPHARLRQPPRKTRNAGRGGEGGWGGGGRAISASLTTRSRSFCDVCSQFVRLAVGNSSPLQDRTLSLYVVR